MAKTIEVHRHFNLVEMQQEDPGVKAWLGQSYRGIGPYFDAATKSTATGLTFEEQKILLPHYLGIEATDKDFRKTVVRFYDELVTSVPKDGITLNIGLEDPTKPLSDDNLPVNIKDFITWRHIRGHRDVAHTLDEAKREWGKRYYIHDPDGVSVETTKLNDLEDRAIALYMRFKDDIIRTDQILTMLGVSIKGLKTNQKVLALKKKASNDPKLSDTEQRAAFERFISTVEDRDLEYKYLIQEMIGAQYLTRVGNNILYAESGEQIGVSLEDAVLYFRNPMHSRELNLLRAEYQTKVKKGIEYLPKENPVVEE